MATIETKAEHRQMTNEEYHAHPATGASMLADFLKSRRFYEGRYITGTVPRKTVTPAMELGTWVHCRVLEPERWKESLAPPLPDVAPDGKKWLRRKGSEHEAWWQAELDARAGKLALTDDQITHVEAIATSLLSKRHARRLLEREGEPEFSIFWTDHETGLELKCRVDWMAAIPVDLKTTSDPSPSEFAKRIVQLGYHRSRAHYLAGIRQFTGEDLPMVHVAVSTEPPYSAGAYNIDDTDNEGHSLGYHQWRYALRELAKCLESGCFADSWEHEIIDLRLPGFAFTEQAYLY